MTNCRPACVHCGHNNTKLRRQIIANGANQIAWWCINCQRWAVTPVRWISYYEAERLLKPYGANIGQIPVVEDYSNRLPCIICGAPGELHHWAPQSLKSCFGEEWSKWPLAPLCVKHHLLWHQLVTPTLAQNVGEGW